MMRAIQLPERSSATYRITVALLAVTIVALVARNFYKIAYVLSLRTDVRYFWVAGRLWRKGLSPYSPLFGRVGRAAFPNSAFEPLWVYPPTWFPLSWLVSLPPYPLADRLWGGTTVLLDLAGAWLLVKSASKFGLAIITPAYLLFVAATLWALPTLISIMFGQTGGFIFLGGAFLIYGLLARSSLAVAIGAYLVLLKPNLGITMLFTAGLFPRAWKGIVVGGLISLMAALPAFWSASPITILKSMLADMATYQQYFINSPDCLVGIFHFTYKAGFARPPTGVVLLCSIAAAAAVHLIGRYRRLGEPDLIACTMLGGVAATAAVSLPHQYDLMFAYPLGLLAWRFRWWAAAMCCLLPVISFKTMELNAIGVGAIIAYIGTLVGTWFHPYRESADAEPGQPTGAPLALARSPI